MKYTRSVKIREWGSSLVIPLSEPFKNMGLEKGDTVLITQENNNEITIKRMED